MTPQEQAETLITWAEALQIRGAVWVGHSLACNVIAHLLEKRPDLCRAAVMIGPLWTRSTHPMLRLFGALFLDAFREPLRLFAFVIPAYWRTGVGRWWMTFLRAAADMRSAPPENAMMIAGQSDPLPDPACVTNIITVPGAHACHFSDPKQVAEACEPERASLC